MTAADAVAGRGSYIAANVTYEVANAGASRAIVERASLRVDAGQVHALLGPNGAGKSTLLKLLAGDLSPDQGSIELNGKVLTEWNPRERARQRAVLPQAHALAFGFTSEQVVALGRQPCPRHDDAAEAKLVREALARAGVAALAAQKYPTLSGGERARVQLARVMAQVAEPLDGALAGCARFVLLDEPTASLDLAHQHDCLRAARALAAAGLGILVILHDPNLALRYADVVTLLRDGKVLASGTPRQALTADSLTRLYRIPIALAHVPGQPAPVVVAAAADRVDNGAP
jgi:iron complex transport system ATP-binding protein